MSEVKKDYNQDFSQYVKYTEDSPTYLVRVSTNKVAGSFRSRKNKDRFKVEVSVNNESYAVHRIIWVLFNGSISSDLVIDHIDGNPWNNSISNLRLVTLGDNARNRKLPVNNVTGFVGVSRSPSGYSVSYYDGVTRRSKLFTFKTLGDTALSVAVNFRKEYILGLEQQGIFYSDRHGT